MSEMQIRLTGSGGQGVILASIILADAALRAGKNVAQSQSYGPEARGGSCKAEVLVSEAKIGFTKVTAPTFVMALTKESALAQRSWAEKGCRFLIDDSIDLPELRSLPNVVGAPILSTAREQVGKAFTANIVAVAVINKLLDIAPLEQLSESVLSRVPAGTEALNLRALDAGEKLAEGINI